MCQNKLSRTKGTQDIVTRPLQGHGFLFSIFSCITTKSSHPVNIFLTINNLLCSCWV